MLPVLLKYDDRPPGKLLPNPPTITRKGRPLSKRLTGATEGHPQGGGGAPNMDFRRDRSLEIHLRHGLQESKASGVTYLLWTLLDASEWARAHILSQIGPAAGTAGFASTMKLRKSSTRAVSSEIISKAHAVFSALVSYVVVSRKRFSKVTMANNPPPRSRGSKQPEYDLDVLFESIKLQTNGRTVSKRQISSKLPSLRNTVLPPRNDGDFGEEIREVGRL
ncbi:hypothetical protein B0H14DRAFT_2609907 [Mycena olivaceomarginata]|nr:hypothetical protein B0H14DRAFT_2609907 [Mycena olivaceomarginata]